jgi:phosphatidate phosphatase PAH1
MAFNCILIVSRSLDISIFASLIQFINLFSNGDEERNPLAQTHSFNAAIISVCVMQKTLEKCKSEHDFSARNFNRYLGPLLFHATNNSYDNFFRSPTNFSMKTSRISFAALRVEDVKLLRKNSGNNKSLLNKSNREISLIFRMKTKTVYHNRKSP